MVGVESGTLSRQDSDSVQSSVTGDLVHQQLENSAPHGSFVVNHTMVGVESGTLSSQDSEPPQSTVTGDLVHQQLENHQNHSAPHGSVVVVVAPHTKRPSQCSESVASEANAKIHLPETEDYADTSRFLNRQKALRKENLKTSGGLKTAML
eukprot:2815850-Rhodomonas_salina.2